MMNNQLREKIKNALQKFPKELKYEVTSEEAFDAFLEIVKKHGIEKEKTDRFSDAVYSVAYGVEPLETLTAQIEKALDGNIQKVQPIAEDVRKMIITENLKNYLAAQKTGMASGIEKIGGQYVFPETGNMIKTTSVSEQTSNRSVMANGEVINKTQVLHDIENPQKVTPAFEHLPSGVAGGNIIDDKLNKIVKLPRQEKYDENGGPKPEGQIQSDPYREPIE